MYYEHKKHDGSLPLIGVNSFLPEQGKEETIEGRELARSEDAEKQRQVDNLAAYHKLHCDQAGHALEQLQQVALRRDNIFASLIEAAKSCSLGQMSGALYAVGGLYRRNM